MPGISVDEFVDYPAEFKAVVKGIQQSGDNITGYCPFHNDTGHRSFSANLKTGQWNCFAEGTGGNFLHFWALLNGHSREDTKWAYLDLCRKYHIPTDSAPRAADTRGGYTLDRYAFEKRIPADYLRNVFHLSTGKERNGTEFLRIPYFSEDGAELYIRKRFADKEFRWGRGSKGKLTLYGQWRLPDIRREGWVILVEGESDTQTLSFLGFPALGVPGATIFQPEHNMMLQGLRLYVHQEPDAGGDTFRRKVMAGLFKTDFDGDVYVWSCRKSTGLKDPSEVYLAKDADKAKALIREALDHAEQVDLAREASGGVLTGAPVALKTPPGWSLTDEGIRVEDRKSGAMELVSRVPIILTQRQENIQTGEEKVEVSFRRDGIWKSAVFPRSTVFTARSILALSDMGATVSSENAKQVVSFLDALEAENLDAIPRIRATSAFGWQSETEFLPGNARDIVVDVGSGLQARVDAFHPSGTMQEWIDMVKPYRSNPRFRFILAAAFAPVLLRAIGHRVFFVYNWGGSLGGKTAALKAALSAWGDPSRMMLNFNATQVALERTAALYSDLPLGIDERQLAGDNQGALEKVVYMLTEGTGRARGTKSMGLQKLHQWRCIVMATGEEPLSTETSKTGVSNRVLEIYGAPFDSEKDAARMHQHTATCYGHAGPYFTAYTIGQDDQIRADFADMQNYLQSIAGAANGSHVANVATIALADRYLSFLFFGETPEAALQNSQAMGKLVLTAQAAENSTDVNENAVRFVTDWVMSNNGYFEFSTAGQRYGYLTEQRDTAYIFSSVLTVALTKAGYSPRKTLKYMAEKGLITVGPDGKFSIPKRFDKVLSRFVEFHLKEAVGADEPPEGPTPAAAPETPLSHWNRRPSDPGGDPDPYELPF